MPLADEGTEDRHLGTGLRQVRRPERRSLEADTNRVPISGTELRFTPDHGMANLLAEMRDGIASPEADMRTVWIVISLEEHEVKWLRFLDALSG